jgi:Domain of unknown function (DUF929)
LSLGRRATLNSRKRRRRILTVSVVVMLIALLAVVYFIVAAASNSSLAQYIGKPVSSAVLDQVTGVGDSTLATIGAPAGVTPPASITGSPLTSGGKAEVLYVGGDYCPYCAIERWSLVVALSRFGQFSGLEYMLSSSTDVNANSPTFTFSNISYVSNYIAFVAVEKYDRTGSVRQALTTGQQAIMTQYDVCLANNQSGGIPFVDIGNAYAVNCGAQSTLDISGLNWTQVASQLNTPTSNVAKLIDGAANTLITAICKVDGNQPGVVCSQSYASLSIGAPAPLGEELTAARVAVPPFVVKPRWTA